MHAEPSERAFSGGETALRVPGNGGNGQTNWELPPSLLQLQREGDAELLREVVALFQKDTLARLEQMQEAVSKSDAAGIKKQAHILKGSAIQLGAELMARLCQEMEACAAQGMVKDLPVLLAQLGLEFDRVWPAMAAWVCQ